LSPNTSSIVAEVGNKFGKLGEHIKFVSEEIEDKRLARARAERAERAENQAKKALDEALTINDQLKRAETEAKEEINLLRTRAERAETEAKEEISLLRTRAERAERAETEAKEEISLLRTRAERAETAARAETPALANEQTLVKELDRMKMVYAQEVKAVQKERRWRRTLTEEKMLLVDKLRKTKKQLSNTKRKFSKARQNPLCPRNGNGC
jgi:hypothetical protein